MNSKEHRKAAEELLAKSKDSDHYLGSTRQLFAIQAQVHATLSSQNVQNHVYNAAPSTETTNYVGLYGNGVPFGG